MSKEKIEADWWGKAKIFAFITLMGWIIGIPLLIGGLAASISALAIIGIVLIIVSFFGGMIGGVVVYLSYVKKLAKKKSQSQNESAAADPRKKPTALTYRQRGRKERGEYAADIFSDSINTYKILPKKAKIGTILVLVIFGLGVALFITGVALLGAEVKPLGYIIMFSGFGSGAGVLIVMGLVKSLPERLKVKRLMKIPKRIKVYEKEATVFQSIMHSSKEYGTERNHAVSDIIYSVYLNCDGETVTTRSFNYYKKGAKIKVYIEAAKPKNVYIALENLIIPIIIEK